MGYKETGVVQIVCEGTDTGKIIYGNNTRMQRYQVPGNFKEVSYITGTGQRKSYDLNLLKKIADDTEPIESDDEKSKEQEINSYGIEYDIIEDGPKMIYTDITETEMFGFPEIARNVLTSSENGLWAYHGLRKLKFNLYQLAEKDDGWKINAVLYFNKKGNDDIPEIRMEEISMGKASGGDDTAYEFYIYVDTNKLGEAFDKDKQKILFSGYLEISFQSQEDLINDVTYCFPVELRLNNTNYMPAPNLCVPLRKKTVSIDFGTSASCVAVTGENGIELLTLSASEEGREDINIYENPTCVMIYRWEEIYQQWRKENPNFPIILKGNLEEEKRGDKKVQFDFGYSVKDCLNEVDDDELNAILTEIKMIPKRLQEGNQTSVRPLVVRDKKIIEIVDSYEKQDDEKFDVVAFYGYILGKAINRVEKNRIYTRFQITYPVKFNEKVREKMCASLEYGLKRAVPLPLRDARDAKGNPLFKVEMSYSEPVAYIGSVCGKYLKIDKESKKAQMFAVYDFGGGTLDYSFGIFAPDAEDPASSNIYILGVDGDSNVGGELLIKKMSYWVYTSPTNVKQFVNRKIPFEKPVGEVQPDNCPEELLNRTASAKANVRKINERITRAIFEGKIGGEAVVAEAGQSQILRPKAEKLRPVKQGAQAEAAAPERAAESRQAAPAAGKSGNESIQFMDSNDESVTIDVSYDSKEINERLEKILLQTVLDFKASLIRAFEGKKETLEKCGIDTFDLKDVHIFKAGNSSRNKILGAIMDKEFEGNDILLVDETNSVFMSNYKSGSHGVLENRPKQVAVTPKTAVALGQLKLSGYNVVHSYTQNGPNAPFNWYVGTINGGNNEFEVVVDKVAPPDGWVIYGRVNNTEDMKVYYSETRIKDADSTKLNHVEISDNLDGDCIRKYLYVRIKDSDMLEGCVCEKGKPLDGALEVFDILLK